MVKVRGSPQATVWTTSHSDVRGGPAVVVDLSTKGETSSTLFKHPTAFDTADED